MKKLITIFVNGDERKIAVDHEQTLRDVLRNDLGLTGTKRGCDLGVCGACTVILDGKPVASCLVLAVLCDDKHITTIEGLEDKGKLHAIQRAFIFHGAIQCGFCTPGMILSAKALIDCNPNPTDEEIKEALSGNICRCTGYTKILEAVRNWKNYINSDELPKHSYDLDKHVTVGRSMPRVDAYDKATGKAKYVEDYTVQNMLYGKILTSPIAHGIIKKIDTSEAEKLPGVKAVITGKDVPDRKYGVSPARYDEFVLAKDRVRYVGDEVAAVAAIDEKTAEKALSLIQVTYEVLPSVFNPQDAIKDGAPQLHERYKNNINTRVNYDFGDVEKGFEEADHIREETFIGNHIHQAPMEPHAAIAYWEGDGTLVLYSTTQVPHYLHYMMANVLDIPLGSIRIIKPHVGGGFGGKAETCPLDLCSAILAKKTGRPVKMTYTRKEMFQHGRGRHKQYMKMKLGVKKNGRITAFDYENYLDGGAYSSFGVITAYYAGSMLPTSYKFPAYRYNGYRVMTNKPACGAMRGHGVPQPRFALECLLNMVAEDIGVDPFDIRIINGMDPNSKTINDLNIQSCEFKETLRAVRKVSMWDKKYGKLPPGKGIGLGTGGFVSGAGYAIYRGIVQQASLKPREHTFQKKAEFPHSNAIVKVSEDGTAAVLCIGSADIGQGSSTVLTQMCAEGMGVLPESIRILTEDTDISPIDLGAYSSRTTLMGGYACARAGFDVACKLFPIAAKMLNVGEKEVVAVNGRICVNKDRERWIDWAECARIYFSMFGPLVGTGCYKPPEGLGGDYKGAAVGTSPAYSFGSAVCEVTVDLETGKIKIDKFSDYHDCGTPINPMAVHGQVEGAIVMAAGETIMENVVYNDKGELVNPNLHEYLVMTIKDAPEIFSGLVDSYEPAGPYGAKEIGEGSTVPVLGAIAHAIKNATGIWFKELPITPEKILKALKSQKV